MMRGTPGHQRLLLSVAGLPRLRRLLPRLFDEAEFLSPHGLRSLSAYHREHPYDIDVEGVRATIDYEPAESTTPLFGGNSNWRGPVWFPLNYLLISVLGRYHRFFGDDLTVEYPAGSGRQLTLDLVAADLQDRLISIFVPSPVFSWAAMSSPRPMPRTVSFCRRPWSGSRWARRNRPAAPARGRAWTRPR